jgi:branched-chain amino acid transport system ATP-binding protein
MLRLENINVSYGEIPALHQLSLEVLEGEMVALIGANGAGKTTTLNTISAILKPTSGQIWFDGQRIDQCAPERVVDLGILHVPEGRRVFAGLTVEDNLNVGATRWRRRGMSVAGDIARVFELFPRLKERRRQLAWSLSGGEQQMLALGRALMARPRVLLLDEPSLGLAPNITQEVFRTIRALNRSGLTVLLVEQDAYAALRTAHRGYVMEMGSVALQGPCNELRDNPNVREIYLGG